MHKCISHYVHYDGIPKYPLAPWVIPPGPRRANLRYAPIGREPGRGSPRRLPGSVGDSRTPLPVARAAAGWLAGRTPWAHMRAPRVGFAGCRVCGVTPRM